MASKVVHQLQQALRDIRPLATALAAGGNLTQHEPPELLSKVFSVDAYVGECRRNFNTADQESADAIASAYRDLLQSICESQGSGLASGAYQAVEVWLRKRTLATGTSRPRTTLPLVWLLLAIHNWLWWLNSWPAEWQKQLRRPANTLRPRTRFPLDWLVWAIHNWLRKICPWLREWEDQWRQSDEDDGQSNEERDKWIEACLIEDVDPFLDALDESDDLASGDLIAVHVLTSNLRGMVCPPDVARIRIAPHSKPQAVSKGGDGGLSTVPGPLTARLDRMTTTSPISRLALTGTPQSPNQDTMASGWRWLPVLMTSPGAVAVRQYLSSHLGERLVYPNSPEDRVAEVLDTLKSLDRDVSDAKREGAANLPASWNYFLGQVLWATLANTSPTWLPRLWARWTVGHDREVSLAEWCGRLARRAEREAQHRVPREVPEWAWVWSDVAKATLRRWLAGQDHAVLCLGLWLTGYLGTQNRVPWLTLGRRATKHSLEQIVRHWQRMAKAGFAGYISRRLGPEERDALVGELQQVQELLKSSPAFKSFETWADDSPETDAFADDAGDESDFDAVEVAPIARMYRCD